MKTVFIYVLRCPISGQVRYVGKSVNPKQRFRSHICDAAKENNYRSHWIASLIKQNLKPEIEIIDEVQEIEWPSWEVAYIEFYRAEGCKLVNGTPGGEDPPSAAGKKFSLEHCAKISAWRVGKKLSIEQTKKARDGKWGKLQKNNISGFVGVRKDLRYEKWKVTFGADGKKIHVGYFNKIEDAVLARALSVRCYYSS